MDYTIKSWKRDTTYAPKWDKRMGTLETSTPSFWYAFHRQSELRSVLFQCTPDVLLSAYRLWRFELAGDGRKMLLLTVKDNPLPPNWCTALTPTFLREDQNIIPGDSPHTEDRTRLSLKESASNEPFGEGWAFPIREGTHLMAALGFETVPSNTEVAWVLLSLPCNKLHEAISDHFTLNNHDLRCSAAHNGRQWLWAQKPELYLLLKLQEDESVHIYQSFPEEKSLFTPWGYRSSLGGRLRLPQDESLLLFDLKGGSEQLDTANWWMASEVITIDELPHIKAIQHLNEPPQIPVKLKFHDTEPASTPTLWFLADDAQQAIESLFFAMSPTERSALSLFVGHHPDTQRPCFLLRDERPNRAAPLFSQDEGTGFLPLLEEENLFLDATSRVLPSLPPLLWRNMLSLKPAHITLLFPPGPQQDTPRIYQFPANGFVPLEQFVQYVIGGHRQQIKQLATTTTFDVMFEPATTITTQQPAAPAQPQDTLPSIQAATTPTEPKSSPAPKQTPPGHGNKHVSGRIVHTPRLQQVEHNIQQKARKNNPIQPSSWVTLASLYQQEYEIHKDPYWLYEALKSLDQVLYLDRRAPDASDREWQVLMTLLQVDDGMPFEQRHQQLEEQLAQELGNPLFMRMIFRYRSRWLLKDTLDETHKQILQRCFYRDLAQVEDLLMIRECMIYVAGVAQYLEDTELFERARLRYRQMLSDAHRLQRELPDILMNY